MLRVGGVILVNCTLIKPPKPKFAICVSPNQKLFFFINSKPRRLADAQVKVQEFELACLAHDSYVDTSKMVTFSVNELASAQDRDLISNTVKLRIKNCVRNHSHLPGRQIELLEANF